MDTTTDTVTVPRTEYDELKQKAAWSDALDAAGVDNWEGYDEARNFLEEDFG